MLGVSMVIMRQYIMKADARAAWRI